MKAAMSSIVAQTRLEVAPVVPVASPPVRAFRPFPQDAVDVVCVEESAGRVSPRMHNRLALVLLRLPAIVRLESSRSIVADRNWILVIPPRHLYALRAPSGAFRGSQASHVTLQVGPSHLEALASARRPALVSDAHVGDQLANLITQFQRHLRLADYDASIQPLIERIEAQSSPIGVARSGLALDTLVAVREYIRTHVDEQISTQALSRYSGLTESHLIRAFHQEFGLPPHAYHVQLRLAQACELLGTGLPVSSVAYECGFADQSHLSRKFKATYGLTPAAWANAVGARDHVEPYSSR